MQDQTQDLPTPELEPQHSNSTEELQVTGTEEGGEKAVLDALENDPNLLSSDTEEPVAQEESAPEVETITYNNINDVDVSSLPDNVRSHVEPILALAKQEASLMKAEKEAFENARKEFTELIDAMESSGYDVKPLQTRIDDQNEFIKTMSTDIIDTAWQAFTVTHPEFDNIPDNARQLFSKELERLYERHDGKTVLDRMNNAYDYALWRSGVDKKSLSGDKGVTVSKQTPAPKQSENKNAPKQAVIADGRIATSAPVRSVDQLDWGEVLDRHAHLLDR